MLVKETFEIREISLNSVMKHFKVIENPILNQKMFYNEISKNCLDMKISSAGKMLYFRVSLITVDVKVIIFRKLVFVAHTLNENFLNYFNTSIFLTIIIPRNQTHYSSFFPYKKVTFFPKSYFFYIFWWIPLILIKMA